jgi:hypothetical protein
MKKILIACALGLLLCTQVHADLIISEVYFDSTDERVEVYNSWSETYSGGLILSGAKASVVNIPNINIYPAQAIVVGDNMSMVTEPSVIAKSWLSLNFPDTQPINVRIMSWSTSVSTFVVDTGTMATAKLTNASIHKNLWDNNTYISQEPYVANNAAEQPSNPWVVYTWFVWFETPDLIISEIYFEWADERFEISNKGSQDFLGEITVQWLSNLPLTMSISIPAQTSVVIADTITSFIDASMVTVSTENLVIPDDGNIEAILSYQSQRIDVFDVAEDLVAPYIDSQNSFEKVLYNSQLQITVTTWDRISNVPAGIVANPGAIFTVYDQVIDIWEEQNQWWWNGEPPLHCTTLGSEIQISEVFFGSGNYQPYIELYMPAAFDQNITLSWSLLNNPVTFSINEEAGDYFLVSIDTNELIDNNSLHDNQELSIRWELWYLEVYGQNGQVLDIVDVRTLGDQNGVIFSSLGDCQRVFESTATMSPWFDHNLLDYKPSQTIVRGWGWWGGGGWSCSLPDPDQTGEPESIISTSSGIDIVDIIYDPFGSDTNRETITLHSLFTTDFDLGYARMAVSTRSWTQSLSGILYAWQTQTFTGNFRFPNTSACVSLLTGSNIFDIYCYPPDGNIDTGSTQMTGVAIPLFTGYFAITNIIYDPEGSDTNNETMSFSTSGVVIDSDTHLLIWSRKFNMEDFVWFYSGDVTLTGNFRFPNSVPTCVLRSQGIDIVDTYCYDPFADDILSPPDIRIRSIVYDPPGSDTDNEQISLELISPASMDLQNISLRIGTRNATIDGTLTTGGVQTFTDNFRFPNYDACVSVMFDDSIIDTLCYQAEQEEDNSLDDNIDTKDYTNTAIDIIDIVYDPAWNDISNEELHLTVSSSIDLADDFYLMINDTKRYLNSFGTIEGDEILIWNFRFPNTKDTCVSIHRQDRLFDTYCYTPQQEITATGDQIQAPPDYEIHIMWLTPNPQGKDENAENIVLLLSGSLPIDLSQGFNLRVNKTKKKIAGILLPWQEQPIVGNFAFPNTASCISIEKDGFVFDTFCYEKPEEWDMFTATKGILKSISTLDLSILQKSQLTRFGNRLCITYEDATIKCKNAPLKISPNNELKLYKSYVGVLHDYLMWDRNILFYNSPLKLYKSIFDAARQELKQFKSFVIVDDTRVAVYDIPQRFALQYQQAFVDSFADSILSQILWDEWQSQLSIFRDQRFASLDQS